MTVANKPKFSRFQSFDNVTSIGVEDGIEQPAVLTVQIKGPRWLPRTNKNSVVKIHLYSPPIAPESQTINERYYDAFVFADVAYEKRQAQVRNINREWIDSHAGERGFYTAFTSIPEPALLHMRAQIRKIGSDLFSGFSPRDAEYIQKCLAALEIHIPMPDVASIPSSIPVGNRAVHF